MLLYMQLSRKLEEKLAGIVADEPGDLKYLYFEVMRWAAFYWSGLNEDDFCLQSCPGDTLVFGGLNRLVWRPQLGYVADRSYCSPQFLARYDRIGPLPGKSGPL